MQILSLSLMALIEFATPAPICANADFAMPIHTTRISTDLLIGNTSVSETQTRIAELLKADFYDGIKGLVSDLMNLMDRLYCLMENDAHEANIDVNGKKVTIKKEYKSTDNKYKIIFEDENNIIYIYEFGYKKILNINSQKFITSLEITQRNKTNGIIKKMKVAILPASIVIDRSVDSSYLDSIKELLKLISILEDKVCKIT